MDLEGYYDSGQCVCPMKIGVSSGPGLLSVILIINRCLLPSILSMAQILFFFYLMLTCALMLQGVLTRDCSETYLQLFRSWEKKNGQSQVEFFRDL